MEPIDRILVALADPTRRAILRRLAEGDATVTEIAAPFAMSQPAISHHLKVLEQAGLIARRRDGTSRPCRLVPQGLAPVDALLADFRDALEAGYARLDELLAESPARPEQNP